MKKVQFFMMAAVSIFAVASCHDNGSGSSTDKVKLENALLEKYPEATNIYWKYKNGYNVAYFKTPLVRSENMIVSENTAWFDNACIWYMTETDLAFELLPVKVKDAFRNSQYAGWEVDDEADMLVRDGVDVLYVIEVENEMNGDDTEMDLYYSEEGILIREVIDSGADYDYIDMIPGRLDDKISDLIKNEYPQAIVVDVDDEEGWTQVQIVDGVVCRELLFDKSYKWVYTKTGVLQNDVPGNIMEIFKASEYVKYRIDDIDHYRTSTGEYYRFEIESSEENDVVIDIFADGTIRVVEDDDNNSALLSPELKELIGEKYPGAQIKGFDYEKGYIEVDILHEKIKKTVYFNGAGEWICTEWDVLTVSLPEEVKSSINDKYPGYIVEDAEYVNTPSGDYYRIEIEKGGLEKEIKIGLDGTIK